MALYILSVNIEKLFEDPAIDIWFFDRVTWELKEIPPWLDPAQGWVQRYIEGVQCRQRTAKSAQIAVEANPEFPAFVESLQIPITLEKACGQILIDLEGRLYHVGSETFTELTGEFSHDAFRIVPCDPIPNLQAELSRKAAQYIDEKMDEELVPLGHAPETAMCAESIKEAMRDIDDLVSVTFEQLEQCSEKALRILAEKYFEEK